MTGVKPNIDSLQLLLGRIVAGKMAENPAHGILFSDVVDSLNEMRKINAAPSAVIKDIKLEKARKVLDENYKAALVVRDGIVTFRAGYDISAFEAEIEILENATRLKGENRRGIRTCKER